MAYQIGIDLGTTYTAAAVCRSSGGGWSEPEVVTLGTRGATVPSVLYIGPDGSVLVGDAAERRAVTDPGRVVREFKRRIGDPTPVMVGGRAWAPEELSARLVRWVVDRVAEREGGPADRIAVTHPASWGAHKKELLGRALAGQGLQVTYLAEPQAAALHYASGERVESGSTIAVYDLGGGTFDAAVVRKTDTGFGLLGRPEGLERLGGIDFDEVVFEHVREGMADAFAELDDSDPAVLSAVARVRRDCVEAKEALSSDTDVSIAVMLPAARGSVRLHRSEFEAMIRLRITDTVEALVKAVQSAGLSPEQLTAVLLVGGSSRIPLVGQLVSEQLGRPVAVDADPKNAIAKGAALAITPRPAEAPAAQPGPPVRAAAAAAAAAPQAPPARPPRPSLDLDAPHLGATPPQGERAVAAVPTPAAAARARVDPGGGSGPRHGRHAPPPVADEPEWDEDYEYDYADERPKRPVGLLIGVGGVLAVALIVVGAVMWRSAGNETPASTGSSTTSAGHAPAQAPAGSSNKGGKATTAPKATEATTAPAEETEPTKEEAPKTSSAKKSSSSAPAAGGSGSSGSDSGSDSGGGSDSGSGSGSGSGG
jgi:molecular chaperone DnaK